MSNCSIKSINSGCSIYTDKGAPASTLGTNGSIFISETAPNYVYKKSNGTWVLMFNMQGSAGISGANNILLNDFTHSTQSGGLSGANVFSYALNVTNLASNGDIIKVYGVLTAQNNSVYEDEVTLAWYLDGAQMDNNYVLRAPSQELLMKYELTLSRVAINGSNNIRWDVVIYENFSTSASVVYNQTGTLTKDLTAPATYNLNLEASAVDATIVPIQLLVMKFKIV